MPVRCKAANSKGKRCKSVALQGEEFCKDHLRLKLRGTVKKPPFYQRGSFVVSSVVLGILLALYFGLRSLTKEDILKLPTEIQMRGIIEESFRPEPFDKIKESIGKSYPEVGQDIWNTLESAFRALDKWQLPVAESLYKALVTVLPKSAELHFNLASALAFQNKFDSALNELKEAVSIKPEYANAHNSLGIIYHVKGRIRESTVEYRMASQLDSLHVFAFHNLGLILVEQDSLKESIPPLKRAIELYPDFADAHHALGVSLAKLNRFREAEDEFRIAIGVDSSDSWARYNLGTALLLQGKVEESIIELQKAATQNPKDTLAKHNLLIALEQRRVSN